MQKNKRQQAILQIIASQEIDTQEELCDALVSRGYDVTQATVSRDIKELKLCKVAGYEKKYRYASSETYVESVTDRMTSLFKSCVLTIKSANNLIIIKAMRGNAAAVGVFVDSLQIPEIIGSVAGDDNLLIVTDSNENTPKVVDTLNMYLA